MAQAQVEVHRVVALGICLLDSAHVQAQQAREPEPAAANPQRHPFAHDHHYARREHVHLPHDFERAANAKPLHHPVERGVVA